MWVFILSTATDSGSSGDIGIPSTVIVAIISVVGTLGAAYMMFRGKTQDAASWLIAELRNEAKLAREQATECQLNRVEDKLQIEELRRTAAGLQAGLRKERLEREALQRVVEELKGPQ